MTAFSMSFGIGVDSISSRIFLDAISYCWGSFGFVTVALIISYIFSDIPVSSMNFL